MASFNNERLNFGTKAELRNHISYATQQQARQFRVARSDKSRYQVVCQRAAQECQFAVTASYNVPHETWTITSKNLLHTCVKSSAPEGERVRRTNFDQRAMVNILEDVVQDKHDTPVKTLQKLVERYNDFFPPPNVWLAIV